MTRLGVPVPAAGATVRDGIELAAWASEHGYAEAWTTEVDGYDGFAPLTDLASRTETMRLGVGVASVFTRPPALLAMSAATLQELSAGRFVLGLGASSQTLVERWMGVARRRPVTRVRETVTATRLALTGEPTRFWGETLSTEGFRLATGPSAVPIMLGTVGPRMFRLAGEIADGALTIFATAEALPGLLEELRAGAGATGRSPDQLEVVARVTVGLDEDTSELRDSLRRWVAAYLAVPEYNRLVRRQGFSEQADAIAAAWQRRDPVLAARAVNDELLNALVVLGDSALVNARLRAYAASGATTIIVSPVTSTIDPVRRAHRLREALTEIATGFPTAD